MNLTELEIARTVLKREQNRMLKKVPNELYQNLSEEAKKFDKEIDKMLDKIQDDMLAMVLAEYQVGSETKDNILIQPTSQIEDIVLYPTPNTCLYINVSIHVVYKNGTLQVIRHKTENPNDYGSFDFKTSEELIDYYNSLSKQLNL